MASSELIPLIVVFGASLFVFLRFHVLAEPVKPLPTSEELTSRPVEELYKEGSDLVWPFIILANKQRRHVVTRYDRSCVARGIALLEGVLKRTEGNWPAEWCIGKAFQAMDEPDLAIKHFGLAFNLNPRHADIAREYIAECLILGRGTEAVDASRKICQILPENAGLRANLAYALLIAGDVKAARLEVDAAFSAGPDDPVTKNLRDHIVDVQEGRVERPTRMQHPR